MPPPRPAQAAPKRCRELPSPSLGLGLAQRRSRSCSGRVPRPPGGCRTAGSRTPPTPGNRSTRASFRDHGAGKRASPYTHFRARVRLYGIGSLEGPIRNFREDGGVQAGECTCSRGEGQAVTVSGYRPQDGGSRRPGSGVKAGAGQWFYPGTAAGGLAFRSHEEGGPRQGTGRLEPLSEEWSGTL